VRPPANATPPAPRPAWDDSAMILTGRGCLRRRCQPIRRAIRSRSQERRPVCQVVSVGGNYEKRDNGRPRPHVGCLCGRLCQPAHAPPRRSSALTRLSAGQADPRDQALIDHNKALVTGHLALVQYGNESAAVALSVSAVIRGAPPPWASAAVLRLLFVAPCDLSRGRGLPLQDTAGPRTRDSVLHPSLREKPPVMRPGEAFG
jgi:hypothetical protein